ncbi:MAG: glycerophosphodiester phosphodiesterase family protein [Myxococcota bacterium]|nr:glycerophosphodiester phosphodiesterase family protein [Myxococcota bacterium]
MLSPSTKPLVIAHRGASAYRPENTLAAYALAIEQKADMIEIDLHLTRDGGIVIAHDADLEHFGTAGEIADQTLAEIKKLDAGRGRGAPVRVPTLDEVLDEFGQVIPFNLEIKASRKGDYPGLEEATLAALNARDLGASILFSSFEDSILGRVRAAQPGARIAVLVDPRNPAGMLERAEKMGAEAINPYFLLVTDELVESAHSLGMGVYPYTVDDLDQMKRLIGMGVDGLFTNRPDQMRSLVDA